jgi:tryptophan synthase alpha chain
VHTSLVIYLMAGREAPALAAAAEAGGADLIEIGFPFSDPILDGPILRRAAEEALAAGMRTRPCLDCLSEIAKRTNLPLVPMTSAAILESYGWELFAKDVRAAGASALIVSDLPVGAHPQLRRIQLVAPTSTDERLVLAAAQTDGWLYLISHTGTTGKRTQDADELTTLVSRVRKLTTLPLYAGFGIVTPDDASVAARNVDGVIVGTRAVEVAREGPVALERYVASLRAALDLFRQAAP